MISTKPEENANETTYTYGVLFAQPITNGYQLLDSSSKLVMKILKTTNKECFLVTKGNIHGVLVSREKQWFFEYYQNENLVSEIVAVKL